MSPTHKILIDLLNNKFEDAGLADISPEIWPELVSEARRHRVAPLLYKKIKHAGAENIIPAETLNALRKQYLATAARNTILFSQLNELVAILNSKSIPVVLLKGAHLADFVYKDIALRPMSDIDILVKEEDLSEALQIVFDEGYQVMEKSNGEKEKNIKSSQYSIASDAKHFKTLIHSETKCVLEIHCNITSESSPFRISPSDLWLNSQKVELNDNSVFILSPDDLILHLCLHAAYDDLFGYGLGALYDIAVTIKYYHKSIEWQRLWHRAVRWRTERCLEISLYFAKKCFESSFPEKMLEGFHIDKMLNIAEKRIFRASKIRIVDHHPVNKRIRKKVREKIPYIYKALIPSHTFGEKRHQQTNQLSVISNNYFLKYLNVFKEIVNIVRSALHEENFFLHLQQRDNDVLLRKWLSE